MTCFVVGLDQINATEIDRIHCAICSAYALLIRYIIFIGSIFIRRNSFCHMGMMEGYGILEIPASTE